MKKKKISPSLLYFGLLVGHFGKTIHVLYIIWGYSKYFITLGSIFLRITIIASIRGDYSFLYFCFLKNLILGILERHNFILPILIVCSAFLTKIFFVNFIHNNFVIYINLLENYFINA